MGITKYGSKVELSPASGARLGVDDEKSIKWAHEQIAS